MGRLLIIFLVVKTWADQCDVNKEKCCEESEWNEKQGKCTECKAGHYGTNCGQACIYPFFGYYCQHQCRCSREDCDFSKGCKKEETTKYVYVHDDDVKGLTTTTICSMTSDTSMDTTTLKQVDALSSNWNMTKLVIFVIDLILIVLVIIFTCEMLCKRYPTRQRLNCFIKDGCPKDRKQEQGHYEVHSILDV